ncbi:MAG: flagellar basal-body MS-ring/collar protein FliF [Oligoflexus sp.]
MEKLTEFFTKFPQQFASFWSTLNTAKKIAIFAAIALLITALASMFLFRAGPEMEYLFTNLTPEDVKDITTELKKQQINNYVVDDRGIKVPAAEVLNLRLKMTQEGLPSHGNIGWEQFDNKDFTRTEFEQNINKLRAVQGELARTISAIQGIISARVHIVAPEKALFREDEKEPTAAIYLKTYRNAELSEKQIRGITHMVSRSVEGLRPEKITIVDHQGRMLTKVESDDPTSRLTEEMLNYKRQVESDLSNRVKSLVGRIVGPDRVEAKIDVEVDFTREEQTISDIDPDRVVVLSSNTTNQEMSGSGLNPTGIPGAKSNVPGEQEELVANSNQTKSTRNSERLNYEIAKTHKHRILPVGNIRRISAAVIVDGVQAYPADGTAPKFEARTETEMAKIDELVRSAIGYREGRDEVKVHNMLFELGPMQVQAIQEKKEESRKYISTLVTSSVIALALVFFFAFVVRPYFRWLSYDPERKKKEATIEDFKPDLEMGGIQNVQVKEDIPFEKLTPQEQILYLAKHEPVRTTEAIRIMLNPHQTPTR